MTTAGTSAQFIYEAQTNAGQTLRGTLEAATAADARDVLSRLNLRILQIDPAPVTAASPRFRHSLGADDFILFNQQLAHLTAAGLPIERGLRLIAADSGSLSSIATSIATDLEQGVPLEKAFARHSTRFSPLYGELVQAGIASGNLPGMLFNLGRHLELSSRLRRTLWSILSYLGSVLLALSLVVFLLYCFVLPRFHDIFKDFKTTLPSLTEFILTIGESIPTILLWLAIIVVLLIITSIVLKVLGLWRRAVEIFVFPIPFIGSILKRSLLARWCDALHIGIEAGIDLPRAIALASAAVGSPGLREESKSLATHLASGAPMQSWTGGRLITPAIPLALDVASKAGNLDETCATLSRMYAEQADHQLRGLPALLTPLIALFLALVVGTTIIAMFLPLVKLIQSVSGGS